MIRWGILGCGDVTEVKSGPVLQKTERSSVIACMRRDGAKAKDYAKRHKIPRAYDDADDLIGDPEVDAVYIATPPSSHAKLTIKALRAGKPVLVEKPIALDVAECDAMAAAAEKAGQPLCVAYYRRALPRFEKLRELIEDGSIGEPRCVEVRHLLTSEHRPDQAWKTDPAVGGGGFFTDMQTHVLDWLDYVFGPAVRVSGEIRHQAKAYDAEDFVSYVIGYENVVANGLCAYAVGETEERVTVYGSKGSATMGFFRQSPVIVHGGETKTVYDLPDPPHVHQPFVERVIAHLLEGAPNPCPPDAARRSVEIVGKLYG